MGEGRPTALNLSVLLKSYYCCVILLYQRSVLQLILIMFCIFIKQFTFFLAWDSVHFSCQLERLATENIPVSCSILQRGGMQHTVNLCDL
jgi:hypothetical protein